MKALLLSTSLFLLFGGAVMADERHTNVITPDAVKWTENPGLSEGNSDRYTRRSRTASRKSAAVFAVHLRFSSADN
jgi:hypothetical protein